MGRAQPRRYPTPESFDEAGKSYFAESKGRQISLVGLCNYLNLAKQSIHTTYLQDPNPAYRETWRWARQQVEQCLVEMLPFKQFATGGIIFILTNCWPEDWKQPSLLGTDDKGDALALLRQIRDEIGRAPNSRGTPPDKDSKSSDKDSK